MKTIYPWIIILALAAAWATFGESRDGDGDCGKCRDYCEVQSQTCRRDAKGNRELLRACGESAAKCRLNCHNNMGCQ